MNYFRTLLRIRKEIQQHATRFSVVVVVVLFGLFLEAYMHNFNLVYITLFFVFAIAFAAGHLGVFNLFYIEGSFKKQGRFFAYIPTDIIVILKNSTTHPSWSIGLHLADKSGTHIPYIKPQSTLSAKLPFTPSKRGTFTIEGCYLQSLFPLSTARMTKAIKEVYHGVVYPTPQGKSLDTFLQEQPTHYGEEKEFDGLGAYDGSQKISHIHWASVAKGDMAVKVFTKESITHQLFFDYSKLKGDTEQRLSQLCLWVLTCEKRHLSFVLKMPHRRLDSNKVSIDDTLQALANY